jgi:hypothetical protein
MLYTTLLGNAVVVVAISRSLDEPLLTAVALFIAAAILVESCGGRDVPRSWAEQNFHELVSERQSKSLSCFGGNATGSPMGQTNLS